MARTRAHTNTRIINGVDSEPLPSFASIIILRKNGQNISQCGGTLVHLDVVLTAAHCVEDDSIDTTHSINVFVMNKETENPLFQFVQNPSRFSDITSGTHSTVSMRHPHPQYDSSTNENDIMLLKLSKPITNVAPMTPNPRKEDPQSSSPVSVYGFGTTNVQQLDFPDNLQVAEVDVMSDQQCQMRYSEEKVNPDVMLCASRFLTDSCQGDSGGPLLYQNDEGDIVQVGIVSWGSSCANIFFPGVYTRVSAFHEWIQEGICQFTDYEKPSYCHEENILYGNFPIGDNDSIFDNSHVATEEDPDCQDFEDWFDEGGEHYNCDWYALENNCGRYGSIFQGNFCLTAKEACCKCGGGGAVALQAACLEDEPKELSWRGRFACFTQACDRCEGGCFFDWHCQGDLKCRNSIAHPLPGCKRGALTAGSYCY